MKAFSLSCIIIIFLISLFTYKLNSQIIEARNINFSDSLTNKNTLNGRFDHSNNTFIWNSGLTYFLKNSNFDLSLNEQFNTTMIKSSTKLIQDIQNFNLKTRYKITNDLHLDLRVNSIIFSDDRSIGINNASVNSAMTGFDYELFSPFTISMLGGWKFDNQIGLKDKGFSYLIESRLNNYDLNGYNTNLNMDISEDFLSPRKSDDKKINLSIQKEFSRSATNTFNFVYRSFEKDFYTPADSQVILDYNILNNIDQRKENSFTFIDEINYIFLDHYKISFYASVSNRDIFKSTKYKTLTFPFTNIFDLKINELKLSGIIQLDADFDNFRNNFRFGINERDEFHTLENYPGASLNYYQTRVKNESVKDNISKITYISLNNSYKFSQSDIFQFSGILRMLRYDTPSENNYDDRDELLTLINISESHIFNPFINVKNTLELSNLHTVFQYGEQSANNLTNKVIRLHSVVYYYPTSNVSTTNSFEVLANYSIYDFEDKIPSYKSLIFRQFSWIDSTSFNITNDFGLDLFTYIKFYERGELDWKGFKEAPVDFLNDNTFLFQLKYQMRKDILLFWGYKMYFHNRYRYKGSEKELFLTQKSFGPTCKMLINFDSYFSLNLEGWYETRRIDSVQKINYANFNMNIFWYF